MYTFSGLPRSTRVAMSLATANMEPIHSVGLVALMLVVPIVIDRIRIHAYLTEAECYIPV